jgi:hypothetical protein
MDHGSEHITAHPGHSASTADPFTEAELTAMHGQDVAAARAVVVLMCSIFLIGVFIYTIVAISVAS